MKSRQRSERRGHRDIARHRLLEIKEFCGDRLERAGAVEPVDQRAELREVGILLVGIQRNAVVVVEAREFSADPDQARGIGLGIAAELQLEITRAGTFLCVGDTTLAFDLVVKADGMPDRDALKPAALSKEPRDIVVGKIT